MKFKLIGAITLGVVVAAAAFAGAAIVHNEIKKQNKKRYGSVDNIDLLLADYREPISDYEKNEYYPVEPDNSVY